MSAGMTARNLCIKIAGKEILHGLNVDIAAGRRTAIIGPNGAGKTTLLRALAGLNRRYTGEICLDGRELGSYTEKELARVRAILPQGGAGADRGAACNVRAVCPCGPLSDPCGRGGQRGDCVGDGDRARLCVRGA